MLGLFTLSRLAAAGLDEDDAWATWLVVFLDIIDFSFDDKLFEN
jgi:hypothetical protein